MLAHRSILFSAAAVRPAINAVSKRILPSIRHLSTNTSTDDATTTAHNLSSVTLPQHVWAPQVEPALFEVQASLDRTLKELRGRSNLPQWNAALDCVCEIASAKHRHLLVPQVFLLGAVGATGNLSPLEDKGMWQFAASLELHHLFMLTADDSMDNAQKRRGKTTVNQMLARRSDVQSRNVAPLTSIVADMLHVESVLGMSTAELPAEYKQRAMERVLRGSQKTALAQFTDVLGWAAFTEDVNSSVQTLEDMALGNISHSFTAPLLAGVDLGGFKQDHAIYAGFEKWSHRIGLAFQGLQDLSDLMADPIVTGKDAMNDVREGRISLPLFMLRQRAEPEEWQSVLDIAESREGALSLPSRRMLLQLMSKYELAQRTLHYSEEQLGLSRGIELFNQGEGAEESEALYKIVRPYMDNIADVLEKELKFYRKRLVVDGLERAIDADSYYG